MTVLQRCLDQQQTESANAILKHILDRKMCTQLRGLLMQSFGAIMTYSDKIDDTFAFPLFERFFQHENGFFQPLDDSNL